MFGRMIIRCCQVYCCSLSSSLFAAADIMLRTLYQPLFCSHAHRAHANSRLSATSFHAPPPPPLPPTPLSPARCLLLRVQCSWGSCALTWSPARPRRPTHPSSSPPCSRWVCQWMGGLLPVGGLGKFGEVRCCLALLQVGGRGPPQKAGVGFMGAGLWVYVCAL